MTGSDNAAEGSPVTPSCDCTLEESPLMTETNSNPDHPEVESPTDKYSTTNDQESPMTLHGETTRGVTNDHQHRATRGATSNLSSKDQELHTKPTKSNLEVIRSQNEKTLTYKDTQNILSTQNQKLYMTLHSAKYQVNSSHNCI